jgi:hypothetical protein
MGINNFLHFISIYPDLPHLPVKGAAITRHSYCTFFDYPDPINQVEFCHDFKEK